MTVTFCSDFFNFERIVGEGQVLHPCKGNNMKTKKEIVKNWLPRYTGKSLDSFGDHILLTNFNSYLEIFASITGSEIEGKDKAMPSVTAGRITCINFGMGAANAATIMDLLASITPKAALFLGKCGGLKKRNKLGDMILPIAAIKGEGASNNYFPDEVPALPAFSLQRAVSHSLCANTTWTIGQELFTQQADVYGNMTQNSKNTFVKFGAWPLTWRHLLFFLQVFQIKFQLVHYCWLAISL